MYDYARINLAQPHVLFYLGQQCFALPLKDVKDVRRAPSITTLPHIPSMLCGITVMRGQLATAVDLAACLNIALPSSEKAVALAVEHDGEQVAFLIDRREDVLSLPAEEPSNTHDLPYYLQDVVAAVIRRGDSSIYVLDAAAIIDSITPQQAA